MFATWLFLTLHAGLEPGRLTCFACAMIYLLLLGWECGGLEVMSFFITAACYARFA